MTRKPKKNPASEPIKGKSPKFDDLLEQIRVESLCTLLAHEIHKAIKTGLTVTVTICKNGTNTVVTAAPNTPFSLKIGEG